MPEIGITLGAGVIAASVSGIGVAWFRRWAEHCQILDRPNERSSHTHPVPRGGGLVIAVVTLIGGGVLAMRIPSSWTAFAAYVAGAVLIGVVSWIDDLRTLPGSIRFAVHLLGALIAVAGIGYWHELSLPLIGILNLGLWGALLTTVWIVGLTNAYNFMDGTDGIAACQGLVAGLGWTVLGVQASQPVIGSLGFMVASTSAGFLAHNWSPARIFMGDVGSAFLGYTLAVLPVMYVSFDGSAAGVPLVGLLLVWPFVFDTTFTFLRRLLRREKVFSAHRSHLYQRMSTATSGHPRVALIYSGLALAGGLLAAVWSKTMAREANPATLALPALCLALWVLTLAHERRKLRCAGTQTAATAGRNGKQ